MSWRVTFKNDYYIDFILEYFPLNCGMGILGEIELHKPTGLYIAPSNTIEIIDNYKLFADWLFLNNRQEVKNVDDEEYNGESHPLYKSSRGKIACKARLFLTDRQNSSNHTKAFAEWLNLPGSDWVKNPNSGSMVNHWFIDLATYKDAA